MDFQGQVKITFLGLRYRVRIPHFLTDVRQFLFLATGQVPVCSRAGFDVGCSPGPEHVDLEIRCVVGLLSGVAVDHCQGKNLPAACESSSVILQLNRRYFFP